jgi:hypothetical protein
LLAASEAEMPAGPAPTITTSYSPTPRGRLAMYSIDLAPCSAALRIRPMPPSSPAMKIPGTLVSKFGFTLGMSTPRFSVPNTSLIAFMGQAVSHAPWPMHTAGFTSVPLPLMIPIACSGQALTQAPEPKHLDRMKSGCSVGGSIRPLSAASSRVA